MDSIYNISNSGDSLKIKFCYGGGKKIDSRFTVAYVKITEADYYRYLKEDEAKAKAQKQAVNDFDDSPGTDYPSVLAKRHYMLTRNLELNLF